MGSFRLAAGRLHHHKHFNFAESREETVWPSLRHSCRSELTRQGISLKTLPPRASAEADVAPCYRVVPACRHADGTISSSSVLDVRRMASEDSDQLSSGFPAVHRLCDLRNPNQTFRGQV